MAKTVLIVDDDPTQRRLIQAVLEREGFAVAQAEGGEQALDRLASGPAPDVIVLDLVMPGMSGLDVLKEARARGVNAPVMVLTASGGVDTVVKAMQAGAQDFFIKPASPERIIVSIRNALQMGNLAAEVDRLKKHKHGQTTFADLVGASAGMRMVKSLGERAARANIPVLILGESGVGKELVARAVHGASERAGKPFVAVNCGALPENLVESILFGHEKGAFTGAHDKHLGKFQEAHGGALFLDEVGELPLDMQVKLLRALQEGEIDPVGGKRSVKVDIRLISATNQNLIELVKRGAFREDLYYRLNVFPISIPPLRNRRADIPDLARRFAARFAAEEGRKLRGLSAEALALISRYDWPGNVRQLENAIFRAVVLVEGDELTVAEFPQIAAQVEGFDVRIPPAPVSQPLPPAPQKEIVRIEMRDPNVLRLLDENGNVRRLEDMEAETIRFALVHYRGQMSEMARRLGIGRSTLYRKMKDHGLNDPDEGMGTEAVA